MKINTLIILSLLFVVSCKCNKIEENNSKMVNTALSVIAKGNLYGSGSEGITKQNLVIDNQADWKALMTQMNSVKNISNSFTEQDIDFSKYDVIAIFNEVKGSGGHKIEMDISETSKNKIVKVNYIGPQGIASSVMTQPYYIVKINKTGVPIIFQ